MYLAKAFFLLNLTAMAQSAACLGSGAPTPGPTVGDFQTNCSDLPDTSKDSFCDFLKEPSCSSTHARYAGDCTNFNSTIIHWTCICI